jgi:hypothetical protein
MKKLITIGSIILVFLIFFVIIISSVMANNSYEVDKNMAEILKAASIEAAEDSLTPYSSNPYDHVKNNVHFDNIVALGIDALPLLKAKISNSDKNGLREYILAIAAEEIAKVNLKYKDYGWANGKEWVVEWNRHLFNVQDDIERILNTNMDEVTKNKSLIKLGIPSIPFLLDKLEEGNISVCKALEVLLENSDEDIFSTKSAAANYSVMAKELKPKYENIRKMVLDVVEKAEK